MPRKLAEQPQQLFPKCGESAALQHGADSFSHLAGYIPHWQGLTRRVVEEDDIRGAPHGRGDGAVRLAGDDNCEESRGGSEVGHKRLLGIGWERLREGEVAQNCEDDLVGVGERSLNAGAAELQGKVALVKMPGQAGADGDGALETIVRCSGPRRNAGRIPRGDGGLKTTQETALIFA